MTIMISIQQLNRDLAEQINAAALLDPHSPFAGKKVGIANGQVVVTADTWDEVGRRLRQVEPDASKRYCIEIGREFGGVHEIWGVA